MDPATPDTPEPAPAGFPRLVPLRIVGLPTALYDGARPVTGPITAGAARSVLRPARALLEELHAAVLAEARAELELPLHDLHARLDGLLGLGGAHQPVALEPAALVELDTLLAGALGLPGPGVLGFPSLGLPGLLRHPDLARVGAVLLNEATDVVSRDAMITMRTRAGAEVGRQAYGSEQGNVHPDLLALLAELLPYSTNASTYYDGDELLVDVWSSTPALAPATAVPGEAFEIGLRIEAGGWRATPIASAVIRNRGRGVFAVRQGRELRGARTQIPEMLAGLPSTLQEFCKLWDLAAVRPLDTIVATDGGPEAEIVTRLHAAIEAATAGTLPWASVHVHAIELLDGVHRWVAAQVGVTEVFETVMLGMHLDPRASSGARDGRPGPTVGSLVNGLLLWAQQLEPLTAAKVERLAGRLVTDEHDPDRPRLYWRGRDEV